ncbi:hypothetical protein QE441_002289 [Chryseobacterium sp. SORGH_AS909]|uniref:Uncharacterized protein n=1 Tax=Chryseobacterium camelliae TaxID=1265445 RepID=A0ABU0TGE9_9FLAO|nr:MULTISPECIES: hypothetical protein [unclassified Chryseobacterium]MDQ1095208.1 hypothetical protein [Chryseobacterium camelliae]MDQ1099146.1 hypothetical protein [Chryseobacterium sp. SORGH_AS_1048]MDT3407000.1 hypothetical protein [Pseudacidovorax intermedius]MDR6086495.1 hypothetical protein [Chryseobacterium sp. SORGH_AS_0909]MDR6130866.1 hypothetical protein [Chryseobacterium sp. SORGH_AS_1175]
MKSKIRRISDWNVLEEKSKNQYISILTVHIAIIVGVFVAAACL